MKFTYSSLLAYLLISFVTAPPLVAEAWNLAVTYGMKTEGGGVSSGYSARGQAQIKSGADGTCSGNGTLSVSYALNGPNMSSKIQGTGTFQLRGKVDGKYLLFSFDNGAIPLKGTMLVGGMKMPHQDTFNPATIAPAQSSHSIERRNGATAKIRVSSSGLTGLATFVLSGGQGVKKLQGSIKKGTENVAKSKEEWTLLFQSECDSVHPMLGTLRTKMSGEVRFHPPLKDGPARGEGPFQYKDNMTQMKGRLILDGRVADGKLNFIPNCQVTSVNGQSMGGAHDSQYRSGLSIFNSAEVSLPMEDGAKFTRPISLANPKTKGQTVWSFRGKKREKWKVTIDDKNHEYGANSGSSINDIRYGLIVRFRRTIFVTLENGKVKNSSGTSEFVGITPFANPPWAYKVSSEKLDIYGTGTDIEAERFDQVRNASRFNPPKNAQDAKLKKDWESIKKRKTPYAFPEKFTPGTQKVGNSLTVSIPTPTGYCVGIRAEQNVKEVKTRGLQKQFSTKLRFFEDTERRVLQPRFTVPLQDGYYQKSPGSDVISCTEVRVEKCSVE